MSDKIIKDCIYGHIAIPPLCMYFINTPEFQRLRRIKQLGMCHYVYPSASHTRFEHSIGVMHMAGKLVDHLRNFVEIDNRTKQLIQLGGLYHDIGHFAYSHLFDTFLEQVHNDKEVTANIDPIFQMMNHEDRSLFFLEQVNQRLGLLNSDELLFVSNVIRGRSGDERHYLFEIVNNSKCGVDVDKMDYLRRDAYHTGLPGFQPEYIILSSVINDDNHISFKGKAITEIRDLFDTRTRMHENVYQHKTANKINKIYFCAMKTLGVKLFSYGKNTDDFNIEMLIRTSPETQHLVYQLDNRVLLHNCDKCSSFQLSLRIPKSGCVEQISFS